MESDSPIQKSTEDRFGRWPFAQRVGQVIATRTDLSSIVVGIHAPWGDGKTSVLNLIVEELNQHTNVLVVHFNPWRFPDEAQLLHKFFSTIAAKLDTTLKTKGERFGELAEKYADALSPLSLVGIDAPKFLGWIAKARPKADLEELKTRFEKRLEESGKRVVVVMDDIDRLDKEEMQAIFKLVKLSADFPNTAYVLAFDEQRVAEALNEKYSGVGSGRSFLEKIIQVPLPLPPVSTKVRRALALEGIESALKLAEVELTFEQKKRFGDIFDKAFLSRIETPRLAKRLANAMTFAVPILTGEVDAVDLILLEAIRTFYPNLYASIRENEEIYVGTAFDWAVNEKEVESQVKDTIEAALKNYTEESKRAARLVIQELFPKTGASGLFQPNSYGAGDNVTWAREKRIASKYYFRRYFTYGVPSDDISDKEIEQFIRAISANGVEYVKATVKELSSNNRADVLIEKLRSFEDELPPDTARLLALGIASSGRFLPQSHPVDRFFGLGAYAQASSMIRHLINRIPDLAERDKFALELTDLTDPLPFAFDYSSWIRPLKQSQFSENKVAVVSNECELEIYKRIAKRIAAEASQEPLERRYPMDAQGFYQFWVNNDNEGIRNYLELRFKNNPEEADEFITAVLGLKPESVSERGFQLVDERGWYALIARMIEPEKLIETLKHKYPTFDSPQFLNARRGQNAQEQAAQWFGLMYKAEMSKPASTSDTEHISDMEE